MSPSCTASSTPVTVTVCGTSQLAAVNVRLETSTLPSAGLLVVTGMTTSAVGWLPSTTVNVVWPPDSLVTSPDTGVTSTPTAAAAGATATPARVRSESSSPRNCREGAPESNDDTLSLPWGGDGRGQPCDLALAERAGRWGGERRAWSGGGSERDSAKHRGIRLNNRSRKTAADSRKHVQVNSVCSHPARWRLAPASARARCNATAGRVACVRWL